MALCPNGCGTELYWVEVHMADGSPDLEAEVCLECCEAWQIKSEEAT